MSHRFVRLFAAASLVLGGLALGAVAAPPASALAVSTTALETSPNPSRAVTEVVTLTATVTGFGPTPTGDVMFYDGEGATRVLIGFDTLSNGVASFTTTFVTAGVHTVTAEYEGDTAYDPSSVIRSHTVESGAVSRKKWIGPAGGAWSNTTYWEPAGVPANGDSLEFGDPDEGSSSTNDISGLTIDNITVTDAPHTILAGTAFTLSGNVYTGPDSGASAINGPVTLASGAHVLDGAVSIGGKLSGDGSLRKVGPDTATLADAANDYTGATEVGGGVLVAKPGALGAPSGATTVETGATLRIGVADGTSAEPLSLEEDSTLDVASVATISGAVTLDGDQVTVSTPSNTTVSGAITGADTTLRKTGAGSLTLSSGTNALGGVDVTAGTLSPTVNGALGTGAVTLGDGATLSMPGPGAGNPNRIFPNAISTGVGSVIATTGDGTVGLTGAVTVGGATTLDADSRLNIAGAMSGAGTLKATGDEEVFLTGNTANTGTGLLTIEGTDVWAGKDGAVSVPAGATVKSGGRLAWLEDGQVGDAAALISEAGGELDMFGADDVVGSVASAGNLYLGVLDSGGNQFSSLQTGAFETTAGTFNVAVSGAGADQVKASTVKLGSTLTVVGDLPRNTTITLIDNTGPAAVFGTFAGLPEGAEIQLATVKAKISYKGGTGNDVTLSVPAARSGYWMVDSKGKVYPFGDAKHYGEPLGGIPTGATIVDIEPTADYNGYWVLADTGHVYAYGNAPAKGGADGFLSADEKATSISNDGDNDYWIFTSKGRVVNKGSAGHYKDMSGTALNGPVLGSVGTPTGKGYFMVASDGGIFALGDAKFRGSMGGKPLNGPVVGLAPDPDGDGYWLVGTDGGIFSFFANFRDSMGGKPLNKPVIGMVAYGDGYLMVASDGGIFNFSTKPFKGSLGGQTIPNPITNVAPLNEV